MPSDLGLTRDTLTTGSHSWMADWPPSDAQPITLDATLVLAEFPDGILPSGTVLGLVTATRRHGPYDATAVDGRGTADGHLIGDKVVRAGQHVPASLYFRGRVFEDELPAASGLDTAAKADLTHIRYSRKGA